MESKIIDDLSKFKIIRKINAGSFGSVYLIQDQITKIKYAAKIIIPIVSDASNKQKIINREIKIMVSHHHPNIINLFWYSLKDFDGNTNNVTIIMNYAKNGSLYDLLSQARSGIANPSYDNNLRQKILVGIARGMMYLHENKIIHRDLKPGNIIFDDEFNPLIADFGISKIYDPSKSEIQTLCCGTSIYMAPEVIDGQTYDEKADVYSFGILMYEMLTELIPYPDFHQGKITLFKLNTKVINENYRPEFKFPIKKSLQNLIEKCWSRNPSERPSFKEIFNKLAFNQNSEFDVIEPSDQDYYIEGIYVDELLAYVDDIMQKEQINNKHAPRKDNFTEEEIIFQIIPSSEDNIQDNETQNYQNNLSFHNVPLAEPRVKIQETEPQNDNPQNDDQQNDNPQNDNPQNDLLSMFKSKRKKRNL